MSPQYIKLFVRFQWAKILKRAMHFVLPFKTAVCNSYKQYVFVHIWYNSNHVVTRDMYNMRQTMCEKM